MLGRAARRTHRPRRRVWRPVRAETDTEVSTIASDFSAEIHDQDAGPRGPDGARGTCYAFAVATAIRSAQMRIFGRGVQRHASIVNEITAQFGCHGAHVSEVLDDFCPRKNLRFAAVDEAAATEAVESSRVVLATFWMSTERWERFSRFFEMHPDESLQVTDLFSYLSDEDEEQEGHTVVIVGASEQDWFIKNSWGDSFGQDGYFCVRKDAMTFTFHDVFFYASDLSHKERAAYIRAPPVLDIWIPDPHRSQRNPISSLGWEIEFETLRIERVRKRNCSIALWNRANPYKKVLPGYQILSVNGYEAKQDIVFELHHAHSLQVTLIISAAAKIHDVFDDGARGYSYSHAVATAICNTQGRIFGRAVEEHDRLTTELIDSWGREIPNINDVLNAACRSHGLHFAEVGAAEAEMTVAQRHVIATFALAAESWQVFQACLQDSVESSDVVLRRGQVRNNFLETEHLAAILICGQGYSHDFDTACWCIKDQLGRQIMVEKGALHFRFYDVFFYLEDLSPRELSLFRQASRVLDFHITRPSVWVKGLEVLGWSINVETLQVEWVADWGPIAAYNRQTDAKYQVHPGHIIRSVNGKVMVGRVLQELEHAVSLRIRVVRRTS